MFEKRQHPRLEVKLPVTLRLGGRLLPATTMNISCGGMCLRVPDATIASSAPVEVILDLDDKKRDVAVTGKITRAASSGENSLMGLQFTNALSAGRKTIEEYLGKHLN